ncbi:MAG TPA: hypothetical protein VIJ34_12420 [Acidimicrobiales bacterium]
MASGRNRERRGYEAATQLAGQLVSKRQLLPVAVGLPFSVIPKRRATVVDVGSSFC